MVKLDEIEDEVLYRMCSDGDQKAWQYVFNYILKACSWRKWHLSEEEAEQMAVEIVTEVINKRFRELRRKDQFRYLLGDLTKKRIIDSFKTSVKSVEFYDDEFRDGFTAEALLEAIVHDDYGIEVQGQVDVIDQLNQIIRIPNLFDLWKNKTGRKKLSGKKMSDLVSKTKKSRRASFPELDDNERKNVMLLNRLILESAYQGLCPTMYRQRKKPDLISIDQAITDVDGDERRQEFADPDPSPERVAMMIEAVSVINAALNKFPEKCRAVLGGWLQYKMGVYESLKELSTLLTIPVPTIAAHVSRCLQKLAGLPEVQDLKSLV